MRAPFLLCPECGASVHGDAGPNFVLDHPGYNRVAVDSGEYGFRCEGCGAWIAVPVEAETADEAERLAREIREARVAFP